jgi:hypothetical protein
MPQYVPNVAQDQVRSVVGVGVTKSDKATERCRCQILEKAHALRGNRGESRVASSNSEATKLGTRG